MRRDWGGEVIVALGALGVLVFALTFGIILSLTSSPPSPPSVLGGVMTSTFVLPERSVTATVSTTPTTTLTDTTSDASTPTRRPASATRTSSATSAAATIQPPRPTTGSVSSAADAAPTLTLRPAVTLPSRTPSAQPTATRRSSSTPAATSTDRPTSTLAATSTDRPVSSTPTATITASATSTPNASATRDNPTGTLAPVPTMTASNATNTTAQAAATPTGGAAVVLPTRRGSRDIGILPTPTPMVTAVVAREDCIPPAGWLPLSVPPDSTLFAIARAVNSTVGELRDANCLLDIDTIAAGDLLYVPTLPSIILPVAPVLPPAFNAVFAPEGCIIPGTLITSPRAGERVTGVFTVSGVATAANFDYYKLEIRPDFASVYNFYARTNTPVENGALVQVNSFLFEPGLHWLRLTVVDATANFDTPCTVPVIFD